MTDHSPNLDLPYIQPSQAQKHVTHNEALQLLDAVVQLSVVRLGAVTPPADAIPGKRYGLGTDPTGAWAGHDGQIALQIETGWIFLTPSIGWRVWDQSAGATLVHDGDGWVRPTAAKLGVNATPDTTNRLAVASDAVLFSHDGDDHQLKINKAAPGDTGSLLFQTGWTGYAEMGLSGSNDWSVKVSPDGSTWTESLKIDAASGLVSGAAVQASPDDTAPGRLMRADFGYGPGNLLGAVSETAGAPTGAVIERGSNINGEYVKFADGTLICTHSFTNASETLTTQSGTVYHSGLKSAAFPAGFAAPPTVALTDTRTNGTWDGWGATTNVTATGFTHLHLSMTSQVQSRHVKYVAVGRWF